MTHSDLEEYSDRELEAELERRNKLRKEGFCSYCRKPFDSDSPCRLHEVPQWGFHYGNRVTIASTYSLGTIPVKRLGE